MVSASYFTTLGMTLNRGRGLSERDVKGAPPVTVVNETFVRKFLPDENPVGKRILVQEIVPGKTQLGPEIPWEIVGVVKDEAVNNLDDMSNNPGMYVTQEQSPVYSPSLVVRAAMDPKQMEQSMNNAVHQIDKDQPLTNFKTLEQIRTESMASKRLNSIMLGGFATVALLLAAIGIYGVISYSVSQRTHEIGIRAALGASTRDVLSLIIGGGMLLTGLGLVIGLIGALALTRLLAALLFGVSARDPLTIASAGAVLGIVALTASFIPARRAARVHPAICLRYD
jgi:putative ABC transport system permease protein